MKNYEKPLMSVIEIRPEERLATTLSATTSGFSWKDKYFYTLDERNNDGIIDGISLIASWDKKDDGLYWFKKGDTVSSFFETLRRIIGL